MFPIRHTLLAAVLAVAGLAACVNGAGHHASIAHTVKVSEHQSDFFQTRTIESNSLRWRVDAQGNRWPVGLSLNAWAQKSTVDDTAHWSVKIRHDILHDGKDLEKAYAYRDTLRTALGERCHDIEIDVDGETLVRPIRLRAVQLLTNQARMPVITDVSPHVIEAFVSRNPPDPVVISTEFLIQLTPADFARLTRARSLQYALCDERSAASRDEIEGLAAVYRWLAP